MLPGQNVDNAFWADLICFHGPGTGLISFKPLSRASNCSFNGNAERVDKFDDKLDRDDGVC